MTFQAIAVGNLLNAVYVARDAVAMHRHDCRGRRCNGFFDAVRVEVVSAGVDVDEYRCQAVPEQRMRCGDERVGRGDDFALDAQRLNRGHQCQGAVGEQREVLHAQILGQFMFELLVKRAAVGELTAFPYVFEVGNELLQRR